MSYFPTLQQARAFLTTREAYEFYAELAIVGVASLFIGKNASVPNRNHLVIAAVTYCCAARAMERLFDHVVQPFLDRNIQCHNKDGKKIRDTGWVRSSIVWTPILLLVFYRFRPLPLELPSFLVTLGCLNLAGRAYIIPLHLSRFFILPTE